MPTLSPRLLAVLATLAAAAPGIALFVVVENVHEASFQRHLKSEADGFAVRLDEHLATRLALVDALSREVEVGTVQQGSTFEAAALRLQERFPGYQAINLMDSAGTILQVVPLEPNEEALGRSVRQHPTAGPVFEEAVRTGTAQVTGPIWLYQGGVGFAGYFPLDGGREGYVNAVFRLAPLIDRLLDDSQRHDLRVEVRQGSDVLYGAGATEALTTDAQDSSVTALLGSHVHVTPTRALRTSFHPTSAPIFLAFWLSSSLLIGVLVFQARVGRDRRLQMERQLAQSSRLDALGTMAGGIAHDFNNTLTVMLCTLEVMKESLAAEPQYLADVDRLMATCGDAAALTKQLLSLASQPMPEQRLFAPDLVLGEARPLLQRLVTTQQGVDWQLGALDVQVMGDPGAFRQAVTNLVMNARDAMVGGGTLTIQTQSRAGRFELRVQDTGAGMDAATLQRIFDPFFTTKPVGAGTGLGLAMVYGTIERMGGRIDASSQVGEGTRFDVSIPVAARDAAPVPLEAEEVIALQGARVLLAEDDHAIRAAFVRTLTRAGYVVTDVADGQQGIALIGQPFDLIVSDVEMPHARGPEMVQRFRERYPEMPVLYCTGFARPDEQLVTSENTVVLEKPFALRELLDIVEVLLHRSQEGAAPRRT